eukprot:6523328-Prymnesium_polylepis.1
MRTLEKKHARPLFDIDELLESCVAVRSVPFSFFMGHAAPTWPLSVSSIREERLLKALRLSIAERNQIEGLLAPNSRSSSSNSIFGASHEQLSSSALIRLATNPPLEVGKIQRRTTRSLLRPFPSGVLQRRTDDVHTRTYYCPRTYGPRHSSGLSCSTD